MSSYDNKTRRNEGEGVKGEGGWLEEQEREERNRGEEREVGEGAVLAEGEGIRVEGELIEGIRRRAGVTSSSSSTSSSSNHTNTNPSISSLQTASRDGHIRSQDDYPVEYSLPDPPQLELNNELSKAERLFEGRIHAPEALAYRDGVLYTGTSDGLIVKIDKGQLTTVATLGQGCHDGLLPDDGGKMDLPCSRPMGLRFDGQGHLIVCDGYRGLLKVNIKTGEVKILVSSDTVINGQRLHLLNSLDISLSTGLIYISDTSIHPWHHYDRDMLSGRSTGRLLRYDPVNNTTEVLIEGLRFANGVQFSKDEEFVLVAELLNARIIKYHLKGERAGQWEVFADNLPCFPDNLQQSLSGGYWTGCAFPRYKGNYFNGLDFLGPRPWLRKILSWLPFKRMISFIPDGSILVELNSQGQVVRTLQDHEGHTVRMSSDVLELQDGVLYIGSLSEPYIARLQTTRKSTKNQKS